MKKTYLLAFFLIITSTVRAQWDETQSGKITTSDNVGIGTTNPISKLDLKVSTSESISNLNFFDGNYKIGSIRHVSSTDGIGLSLSAFTEYNATTAQPTLVLSGYTRDLVPNQDYDAAVSVRGYNIDDNSNLENLPIFKVMNGHSSAYLTVGANGDIGIGTTSPSNRLSIQGNDTDANQVSVTSANSNSGSSSSLSGLFDATNDASSDGNMALFRASARNTAGIYGTTLWGSKSTSTSQEGNFVILTETGSANTYAERFIIDGSNGNIGIGVSNPDSKLVVDGKIRSEEVKVEIINGPDYVFDEGYDLRTLDETKEYIFENKHLPEIPSAKEMETNGVELGDMNMRLLKKIEELTLYQIELLEEMEQQNKRLQEVEKELQTLKN